MIQGFGEADLAKPPGRRELAAAEREYRALAVWYRTGSEVAVAKECRYPNRWAARVAINRAVARLKVEREDHIDRLRLMYDGMLLEMARDLMEAWREGDKSRGEQLLKVIERHSRMAGLEHQKDINLNLATVVLNGDVSEAQLAAIPAGAEVIDARLPPPRQPAPLPEPTDRSSP